MSSVIELVRVWAPSFLKTALWPVLWQSSLLIALLFVLDLALKRKLRPAIRYALWLVILVKLILPPSLALPTGIAWWLRPAATAPPKPKATISTYTVSYGPAVSPQTALAPAAVRVPPPPRPLPPAVWALLGSTFVSAGLLFWMLLRWTHVARIAQRATQPPDWLNALLEETRSTAGIRRTLRLKLTDEPLSPAVCGFFRPVLLLPRALATQLPVTRLRAVLLHELIHLRRGDVWVNCAQALLQIFYWWHPLLWLANARIRRLREEAVDDAVMLALRDDAEDYAPTLLEVARLALRRPLTSLGLVGIVESKTALRGRIERLADYHAPRRAGLTLASIIGVGLFTAMALPMGESPARPQDQPSLAAAEDSPWPDPRYSGYTEVRLEPQFFMVDEASLRTVLPALLNSGEPLVLSSNEVAELEFRFQQANVQLPASMEPLGFAKFSGGTFQWHVGGTTNNSVNYDVKEVAGRTIVTGAEMAVAASVSDWVPLDFAVIPWRDGNNVRCQLELSSGDDTNAVRQAEVLLPEDGTLVWAKPVAPSGKYELVVLRSQPTKPPLASSLSQPREKPLPAVQSPNATTDQSSTTAALEKFLKADSKVQDGKLLFEMGKLDEAVAMLKEAVLLNPQSQVPFYYLNLIGETRWREAKEQANAIRSKLERIRVDTISFDNMPLSDVVQELNRISKQFDPEQRGVKFILSKENGSSEALGTDLGQVLIKIVPPLVNVRLVDLVDAIKKVADTPIRWSIEREAVAFSPKPSGLYVRTFRVDTNALARVGQTNQPFFQLRQFFTDLGVDLTPPKMVYYKDRYGYVMVRATLGELDTIGAALQALEVSPTNIDTTPFRMHPATTNTPGSAIAELQKVPVLGDIPFVERLFRSNNPHAESDTNQPLYVRLIKVDPNTFLQGLASATGGGPVSHAPAELQQRLRDFFANLGVDLTPPKSVFFNDREGTLLVRASLQDLDAIELPVQLLNISPPQINLRAKFFAVPVELVRQLESLPGPLHAGGQSNLVLSPARTSVILKAVESNPAAELLGQASVTTLSGRQTQISVEPAWEATNSLGFAWFLGGVMQGYLTNPPPNGVQVEVLPQLQTDGITMRISGTASATEFLGYDDPRAFVPQTPNGVNSVASVGGSVLPLPHFRLHQLRFNDLVPDGQTLVLGVEAQDNAPVGNASGKPRKPLLVLITPTLIDPAGNRIHGEAETQKPSDK